MDDGLTVGGTAVNIGLAGGAAWAPADATSANRATKTATPMRPPILV